MTHLVLTLLIPKYQSIKVHQAFSLSKVVLYKLSRKNNCSSSDTKHMDFSIVSDYLFSK